MSCASIFWSIYMTLCWLTIRVGMTLSVMLRAIAAVLVDCAARAVSYRSAPSPRTRLEQVRRSRIPLRRQNVMDKLRVGDHVRWNSEAGMVSGRIIRVHYADFDYKGHRHRASPEEPQYEIRSDRSEHIAAHKDAALTKIG